MITESFRVPLPYNSPRRRASPGSPQGRRWSRLVRIGVKTAAPEEVEADLLAVGVHAGEGPPENLSAAAQPAVASGDFTGKRGQTSLLYAGGGLAAGRFLLVGLGDRSSF